MEVNRKGYGLGVVYTMDNEVIPRPCKICDWLLNSIHGHFGLQQGHNIRMTMEFKVPKRHILRPTLSIDIVQHVLRWERQKRCYGRRKQVPLAKNIVSIDNIFGEEKMKTKEWSKFYSFYQIALLDIY